MTSLQMSQCYSEYYRHCLIKITNYHGYFFNHMRLSLVHYVKKTHCTWYVLENLESLELQNDGSPESPYWKKVKISIYSPYSQFVKVQLLYIIPSLKKSRFSIKSMNFHNILHILYGEFLAPYNIHKFSILAIWSSIRFYGENMEIRKGIMEIWGKGGSANGLLPCNIKPLPEQMWTCDQ